MISLVVVTLNRVAELERLFASLDKQSYKDFEVILVDQNSDDRLVPVLAKHPDLDIRHLRSGRGLSRGRNVGLPFAKGDIICFPDDDCWYPEDLLQTVKGWFDSHPEFGALLALMRDENNEAVGPKRPPSPRQCTKKDIWVCGISPNAFLRRQVTDKIGMFNEDIGIGAATSYQSGEDLDYFLRPIEAGFQIWFEPGITVHHPSFHSPDRLWQRTYTYALGGAYILRLHGFSWWFLSVLVFRSLGGSLVSACKGDLRSAQIYLWRIGGLLRGYILGPFDMRRLPRSTAQEFSR